MKIIDLLNKIANSEELPKKFIWDDNEYYLHCNKCYKCEETSRIFEEDFILEDLNDEVEILEEDKKIEKIEKTFSLDFINSNIDEESRNGINLIINELIKKVDRLIDEVNELKEK